MQQELSCTNDGPSKKVYGDDKMPVSVADMTEDKVINLKNLGAQIKWTYVFYIEYAGPLFIFPLLYFLGDR